MRVRQAYAFRVKPVSLNHLSNFAQLRHPHLQQRLHILKSLLPVLERAESNLSNDEWVHGNLPHSEQSFHLRVAVSQVIYPDRCVGQNHRSVSPHTLDVFQIRLCPTNRREPARSLKVNQRFQRLPEQGCSLRHACKLLGLTNQIVIQRHGCSHCTPFNTTNFSIIW